ncbi:MAG: sigma-54-dependent transcriptional regulator [Spirochaetota bacterium]
MGHKKKVLIADDDKRFRDICEELCVDLGLNPVTADNGVEAANLLKRYKFILGLFDLKMPKMGGIDLLHGAREISPDLPVIIITAYGSIETAVEAMKAGAVDYIVKPCSVKKIREVLKNTLKSWKLSKSVSSEEGVNKKFGIIGCSEAMQDVYKRIAAMQQTDNTVLILGESGAGKELVARAIHYYGERAEAPFIPIDCSILSLNIVDSELFGHLRGSFTDAHHDRVGLLKLAKNGTVFFDEITEIPIQAQAKLLRAIQEKEIRPVGSSKTEKIRARIIAASNRNLEESVKDGTFREDLFYRLHVIPISVPPLRERKSDIPLLVDHFIKKYSTEKNPVCGATSRSLDILMSYHWPGNIRELENVIQQAIALGSSEWVRPVDLPEHIKKPAPSITGGIPKVKPLAETEKEAILEALRITSGKKLEAARLLGIGKTTLYEKLKRYKIE